MESKIRLWIEYSLIAVVLAIGGFAVTLKIENIRHETSIANLKTDVSEEKAKVTLFSERLDVVENVNEAQAKVINTMGSQRDKDNVAVARLLDTYQALRDSDQRLRDKLDDLERTDADAKSYFDIPMPESVACLYDDSCPITPPGSNRISGSKVDAAHGAVKNLLLAPEPKAEGSQGGS